MRAANRRDLARMSTERLWSRFRGAAWERRWMRNSVVDGLWLGGRCCYALAGRPAGSDAASGRAEPRPRARRAERAAAMLAARGGHCALGWTGMTAIFGFVSPPTARQLRGGGELGSDWQGRAGSSS